MYAEFILNSGDIVLNSRRPRSRDRHPLKNTACSQPRPHQGGGGRMHTELILKPHGACPSEFEGHNT